MQVRERLTSSGTGLGGGAIQQLKINPNKLAELIGNAREGENSVGVLVDILELTAKCGRGRNSQATQARFLNALIKATRCLGQLGPIVEAAKLSEIDPLLFVGKVLQGNIDAQGSSATLLQLEALTSKARELGLFTDYSSKVFHLFIGDLLKREGDKLSLTRLTGCWDSIVRIFTKFNSVEGLDDEYGYLLRSEFRPFQGRLTEIRLANLADAVEDLGESVVILLGKEFNKAVDDLGGPELSDYKLSKLMSIAQLVAVERDYTGFRSVGTLVKAIGGQVSDEDFGRVVDLALGANSPNAVLQGVAALLTLRKTELSGCSVDEILTGAKQYLAGHVADGKVSGLVAEVFRLAELVFSKDQGFETPKDEFVGRVEEWRNKELPAVIEVNDRSFVTSWQVQGSGYRLIAGKKLAPDLYAGVCKVYLDDSRRKDALDSLWQIAGLSSERAKPGTKAEEREIVAVLKTLKGSALGHGIKAIRGVLPGLSGVKIKAPGDNLSPETKTHELFSSIVENYSGHIPEWLRANGVKLDQDAEKEIEKLLHSLRGELSKLRSLGEREELTVRLVGTKNVYDAMYDAVGENCSGQYGFALTIDKFQPIRLIDPKTKDHIGIVYALKSQVDGVPAMVLAGVEIRKRYAYSIKPIDKFIESLVDQLAGIAIDNGLTGGVWSAVGPAKNQHQPWSDDGRIGQYALVRNAVVELGISRGGEQPFKKLRSSEQIQFPPQFDGLIKRLIRLDRR